MFCDDACTDCDDTGLTKQTERYCSCQAGFDLRASEVDPDLLREDRDERHRMDRSANEVSANGEDATQPEDNDYHQYIWDQKDE